LEPQGNVPAAVADAVHRIAIGRRWALLKKLATGVVAAMIVGIAAYVHLANQQPRREITAKDGAPAVLVSAGKFTMGNGEDAPLREIYVDSFYMDKYEVTTSRYAEFLRASGWVKPPDYWDEVNLANSGNLPVVGVDWQDADAYCQWAGKRLPTEAEWEKAARGTDLRYYPWGNEEPTSLRANFGRSATGPYNSGGLAAVAGHGAGKSPYNVEGLAGNASEWVADWFEEGSAAGDVRIPKGPAIGTVKVIRGGGWSDPADRIKSTKRYYASPGNRTSDVGFRCARDL
jgi:formylglycine-generating enzyme required for sulfatase activity